MAPLIRRAFLHVLGQIRWQRVVVVQPGQPVALPPFARLGVVLAHVAGQLLQVPGHGFVRIGRWQRHADLPQVTAFDEGEALPLGQADHVRRLDERHARRADAVLRVAGEVGRAVDVGTVGGAADKRGGVDLHLRQLPCQQFGGGGLAHPQHEQVVEVADDLAGLGAIADARLDVRERLRIGRDLHACTATLVDERDELIAHQFVELVRMNIDGDLGIGRCPRQAVVDAVLVDVPRHRH